MRAVLPESSGSPTLGEVVAPRAAPGEVVLAVHATALNHVDLMQLRGSYPPPPGESPIPGLEAAGVVAEVGSEVRGWQVGEGAAALLAGGGHAERVAVPAGQLLPIPAGWSFAEAAALPESAITAWTNLVAEGRLRAGERVLVSGATSGVGTFAIPLARALGATPIAAGRDPERLERMRSLGADETLLLDELPAALDAVGGKVDLIVDLVGGAHLPRLVSSLAPGGRLVLVGLLAGRKAELDLGAILRGRLKLIGSVLRPRSRSEKSRLVADFLAFAGPRLARRELVPTLDRVFRFDEIAAAYAHLERGRPFGKVVVTLDPPATT